MLSMKGNRQIYAAMYRVDFRKAHDGLLGECYQLGLDPYKGDVVLFIGRCRRRIKALYADESGLWLSYKRFNKTELKTSFRFLQDPNCRQITPSELSMFFNGNARQVCLQAS